MQRSIVIILSFFILLFSYGCHAQTEAETVFVEKQSFTFENYTTLGGEVIPEVTIGWESYGELNAAKDNVILITHFSRVTATP